MTRFLKILRAVTLPLLWVSLASCGSEPVSFHHTWYAPEHAAGFEIVGNEDSGSRVIRITQAWQGADSTAMELFIARDGEDAPDGFRGQVLRDSATRIVALSSTHIALLDQLGKVSTVKAVSGIDYITSPYIQARRDSIPDLGHDSSIDLERLVSLRPDLVLLYGISSANQLEGRLKDLGIPYLYIGEYLEPDPLGRLEWVIALAEVTGCREKGEALFRSKVARYEELAEKLPADLPRPKVMLNTPYGDTWFMPSENSAMVRLITAAGGDYLCKGNRSNKSESIDLERAYLMAAEADFWLNPGQCASLKEVAEVCPKFTGIRCFRAGSIWNCDKRTNGRGGNDFWESGVCYPELILEDLMNIFHPGLLEGPTGFHYYRPLA